MNVLIVDDQARIARVTSVAFQVLGCRPFVAGTTVEATRLLAAEKIDALFLDVNLAGESGWEFLAQVLARPAPPPVVMFTALARDEVADEAVRRGAFDCLAKPFTLDDLRQQVVRIRARLPQSENPDCP